MLYNYSRNRSDWSDFILKKSYITLYTFYNIDLNIIYIVKTFLDIFQYFISGWNRNKPTTVAQKLQTHCRYNLK